MERTQTSSLGWPAQIKVVSASRRGPTGSTHGRRSSPQRSPTLRPSGSHVLRPRPSSKAGVRQRASWRVASSAALKASLKRPLTSPSTP
eukprot:9634641-Lingulodinium_polyedra.AAC.2